MIISATNSLNQSLSLSQTPTHQYSPQILKHLRQAAVLSRRLHDLHQDYKVEPCEYTSVDESSRVIDTAELYRLAAILYLHRVIDRSKTIFPGLYRSSTEFNLQFPAPHMYLVRDTILSLLDTKLKLCTSPWPMFVLACEYTMDLDHLDDQDHSRPQRYNAPPPVSISPNDAQLVCSADSNRAVEATESAGTNYTDLHEGRRRVLRVIDRMQRKRRIGNIDMMREIIEGIWKHSDLAADDPRCQSCHRNPSFDIYDWRKVVDLKGGFPSFI